MLEDPVVIGRPSFKMTNSQRKLALFDRFALAPASHAHDTPGGRPHQFPFSMAHRIEVHLSEERPGLSGQVGQCLGIHLAGNNSPRLHGGGIQCERPLDFDTLCQQIRFQLPLHHRLPLSSRHRHRHSHDRNGDHEHDVREASFSTDRRDRAVPHGVSAMAEQVALRTTEPFDRCGWRYPGSSHSLA